MKKEQMAIAVIGSYLLFNKQKRESKTSKVFEKAQKHVDEQKRRFDRLDWN